MSRGRKRGFEFTDRALKRLKIPPKPKQLDYFDTMTRGFGLRISYGGRKSFFAMYTNSAGKRQRVSLGEYGRPEDGKVSLAEARKRAWRVRSARLRAMRNRIAAALSDNIAAALGDNVVSPDREREKPT